MSTVSQPTTRRIEMEPCAVEAVASAVRYWTVLELDGPLNSTLLRQILRTDPPHARELWNGRTPFIPDELQLVAEAVRRPLDAFTDRDAYCAHLSDIAAGRVLRYMREMLGLTVEEAAQAAHASVTYWARVESGLRTPAAAWLGNASGAMIDRALARVETRP